MAQSDAAKKRNMGEQLQSFRCLQSLMLQAIVFSQIGADIVLGALRDREDGARQ